MDWNTVTPDFQAYTLAMPKAQDKPPAGDADKKGAQAIIAGKSTQVRSEANANLMSTACTALVLVDYQQRLMPAIHRGAEVVAEACRLANVCG